MSESVFKYPIQLPFLTVTELSGISLGAGDVGSLAFCTDCLTTLGVGSVVVWSGTRWLTSDSIAPTTDKAIFILSIARKNIRNLDPLNYTSVWSDFLNGGTGINLLDGFSSSIVGTASAVANIAPSPVGVAGLLDMNTGSTATGRASVGIGNLSLVPTDKNSYFVCRGRITNGSSATDRYTLRLGFGDAFAASTENVDGVFFRYTDNVNGGLMQGVARTNNVETAVNLGFTPSTTVYEKYEILIRNAVGSAGAVEFFKDGVSVGTLNTNVPDADTAIYGVNCSILKSIGLAPRSYYLDYLGFTMEVTAR